MLSPVKTNRDGPHFHLKRAFCLQKCASKRLKCPYITTLFRKFNVIRWSDPIETLLPAND